MMKDVTVESFRRVFAPKAQGAIHLAEALEGASALDFLVFHSSISALVGNRGQTSYVAANSILDALAHRLRAKGIPATAVNWGALAESGVVARDEHLGALLSTGGITGLTDREAFDAFEKILRLAVAQLGAFKVDWSKWHEAHPHLAGDPRFRDLQGAADDAGGGSVAAQIRTAMADASREQRLLTLEGHLLEALAETLKMSRETISPSRKLSEMGVDSLMVLELSLGIEYRIGISFSAMEFLKGPTLQQLAVMAEGKLWKN
jgi:acyl carrier protein